MVLAKGLTSIGNILSFVILINFLMFFIINGLNNFDMVTRQLVLIVVILGTSKFALVAPQIISSFTGGESANHAEGRNAIMSAVHGQGMLNKGFGALKWAAGIGVGAKLLKNGTGGGADNSANPLTGGLYINIFY